MKVAFDARAGGDHRGIGRYVRSLRSALDEIAAPDVEINDSHRPTRRTDVFHSPWIDGALLRSPCPMVVTLHDVVPLKRQVDYLRTGMRFRLRYLAVQRAVRIIVPTAAVAADVTEHLGIGSERITVIGEAADASLTMRSPEVVARTRERFGLPEDYLLWVGGLEHPDPRKRVAEMAATARNLPLVLVGRHSRWAEELDGVTLTGQVCDDDLAAIYSGARALVFPSDDEGFGLPPVEALACGTPVVACDVPAMREVLQDRVTFVAADDLPGLMARAERATRPAPPPPSWTWRDAATATLDVYRDARSATAQAGSTAARGRRRAAASDSAA